MAEVIYVRIKGEKIGSPDPKRRKLYIDTNIGDLEKLAYELKNFSEYLVTNYVRAAEWWVRTKKCQYCYNYAVRARYPFLRWMCLRHYLIYKLSDDKISIVDNKPRILMFKPYPSPLWVFFHIGTNKYKFNVKIERDVAKIVAIVRGKPYIFTYRKHYNAFPDISSYEELVFIVSRWIDDIADELLFINKQRGENENYNIFVNFQLFSVAV